MEHRPLYENLWKDLAEQKAMVFLSGPRQTGKTTIARQIAEQNPASVYTNWDIIPDRKRIHASPYFFEETNRMDNKRPLVIFDEIHKYRLWKNYLKGVYDKFNQDFQFMVLGSGRLDVFQKGGDSLAGRYYQAHVFPLTVAELGQVRREFLDFIKDFYDANLCGSRLTNIWEDLSNYTGFPEPFFAASQTNYERWSQTYGHQVIREDVRDLTQIKNIDAVESLFFLLPSRVGSLLSVASLSRDLQVAFNSVKEWLEVFERFYLIFRISPWTKKVSRAITKEPKLYLMDYGQIPDQAARFENMVAMELLRAVHNWNDRGLGRFSLHFLRDKDGQEVDFFVANKNVPVFMVESKLGEEEPSKALRSFQNVFHVPAVQVINKSGIQKIFSNGPDKIMIMTAADWLAGLP